MAAAPQENAVVFIHGLWIHSSAWTPWIALFAERGYPASAPAWPGEGATVQETRAAREEMNNVGIQDIYEHYANLIGTLERKPIVIGHSFGGLIAQKLLETDVAVAAVAIDPAPVKGVKALPFSLLRSGFPVLSNPANKKRTVALTPKQFKYSFGNTMTQEASDELFEKWTIPGPGRPLFEDATANFRRASPAAVDTHKAGRGPLLLISGTEDHTVPAKVTREVLAMYTGGDSITEYREFEGRGHALTMDDGWEEVAGTTLAWLGDNGF